MAGETLVRARLSESFAAVDAAGLLPHVAIAERWHASAWCLEELPRLLGAEVISAAVRRDALGIAVDDGYRAIALNERLSRRPLVRQVGLSHECAHLARGVNGFALCTDPRIAGQEEWQTWLTAAIYAVPLAAVIDFDWCGQPNGCSRCWLTHVAPEMGYAAPLFALRHALSVALGEREDRPYPVELALGGLRIWLGRWLARETADL